MSMPRRQRTGLVLCAIALLIAGCSGGGGSDEGSSSPVPRGLGGPGNTTHAHHRNAKSNKPGKKHRHKSGPTSSSSPSNHPVHSATPTQSHSATPTQHTSSTPGGGGGSHSHTPGPTLPTVVVTPHYGLSDTQTVTVEGFHFKPNQLLAVAECHDRGLATGLPDCNINNVITYSPGAKVHSDANGHVGPLQITVRKSFKSVDCGTVKCLVAISEPTLQPDVSDEGDRYIHFA
jgi:hypothetical protein